MTRHRPYRSLKESQAKFDNRGNRKVKGGERLNSFLNGEFWSSNRLKIVSNRGENKLWNCLKVVTKFEPGSVDTDKLGKIIPSGVK